MIKVFIIKCFRVIYCKYIVLVAKKSNIFVVYNLNFFQFSFDSPDYISFRVFCQPCAFLQFSQEPHEIGDAVLSLDKGFLVLVDFIRLEVKGEFK